jgi:hypothetical protein
LLVLEFNDGGQENCVDIGAEEGAPILEAIEDAYTFNCEKDFFCSCTHAAFEVRCIGLCKYGREGSG